MRISLWRQFSSNHSARFTIVGVFESAEAAQGAAKELNRMLDSVRQWLAGLPEDEAASLWNNDYPPPTPPELALAQQYGLDWGPHSLDWLYGDSFDEIDARFHVDLVTTFERIVFISPFFHSDMGASPADALLERLGAAVVVDGDLEHLEGEQSDVMVDLTCIAPDEQQAQALVLQYRQHIQSIKEHWERRWSGEDSSKEPVPPWQTAPAPPTKSGTLTSGRITRIRSRLLFRSLTLDNLPYAVPGLVAHLGERGCTAISYAFKQDRYGEQSTIVVAE